MGALRKSDGRVMFHEEGVAEIRRITSGDLDIEFGRVDGAIDITEFFRGLPGDMCQARHQGYVVRGRYTFNTPDGPVHIDAGEAFDIPPGHIPMPQPGCEWLQITARAEQQKTDEVIQRNLAARAAAR
jgi:hypothetical protein